MFYNIYYEDTPYQLFDATEYCGKIVKVIVRKKSKPKDFERFIDKLNTSGVEELKVIENFDYNQGWVHSEDFEAEEEENTIGILHRYIDESDVELDKSKIKCIMETLYRQACEVE